MYEIVHFAFAHFDRLVFQHSQEDFYFAAVATEFERVAQKVNNYLHESALIPVDLTVVVVVVAVFEHTSLQSHTFALGHMGHHIESFVDGVEN